MQSATGTTALMFAARAGKVASLELLESEIGMVDAKRESALVQAAELGKLEAV